MFAGAGLAAFKALNIEAYPNPTPVILEITAQAPGLSAEEMERYYTRPMEIGLYTTPGIDVIRSTSFYGLSFVRVAELDWDTALVVEDTRRDCGETRLLVMALLDGRLHAAVVTPRGEDLRVISFRRANGREVRLYGEKGE